ncbi:MAG: hypothetical protein EA378_05765 [Phycisphaerales bacterium]|nr:MAG: hypothetical protein EA378_05765 [Phycisphaerales bacterium]
MQREGVDPESMSPDDFLCDFCARPWAEDRPMVEGHRGSIVCGRCLTVAYAELVLSKLDASRPDGTTCVLCLEERTEAMWESPVREGVFACRRCVKQSAGVLVKDAESGWKKPTA